MHTCTLQSLFFSLQVYRAGFLLIMPALLTSRSAYQCIPSHTWTAHHTAQFGTTRGTWEKSLNWKRKKNVVLFREKLNIARCYNSTLHYCTYLQCKDILSSTCPLLCSHKVLLSHFMVSFNMLPMQNPMSCR